MFFYSVDQEAKFTNHQSQMYGPSYTERQKHILTSNVYTKFNVNILNIFFSFGFNDNYTANNGTPG